MYKPALNKKALTAAMSTALLGLTLSPAAMAVTDEEFRELQEQFYQLSEQVEQSSSDTSGNTTVGGYGELHYNNLSNGAGKSKKEIDFHRFVLFFGHEFDEKTRFFSELEVEHSFIEDTDDGSAAGSVAIEQAYVQFDLSANLKANAGVLLVPVGFINETHEPPTFYGVERNPIAKYIMPTTWREGGAMLSGTTDAGFSYDIAVHTGLDGGTNIRGGRQKVANAKANNLAATGRVKYTGVRGLELAATVQYQDDMTQDSSDDIGSATMVQAHARYTVADFTLTGLYAQWDISGDGASSTQKDKQDGGYLEASYKVTPTFGIFVRQNQWDNGGAGDTGKTQTDVGFNYWPHEDVVLKADYQAQNDVAGNFDGVNLGVGYQF